MIKEKLLRIFMVLSAVISLNPLNAEILSLEGKWLFGMDRSNVGIEEEWYNKQLEDTIMLPGTTDLAKKGTLDTKAKTRSLTRLYPYFGPAWYQRVIEIPQKWAEKDKFLFLELTKTSSVWVGDNHIEEQNSITAPHIYDLSEYLEPGKHMLSIRIHNDDNRAAKNSHQVQDGMSTNWNGILGKIELHIKDPIRITDAQVYTDIHKKKVDVRVVFNEQCSGNIKLSAEAWNTETPHSVKPQVSQFSTSENGEVVATLEMGEEVQLWDEFSPSLYNLKIEFEGQYRGSKVQDSKEMTIGMREFSASGTQFQVNGKTVFLRGKHESHAFPITGHVPMEVEEWVRIFRIAQDYGMNHYRFHTCVPPAAAFEAANIVGIYMEPQIPRWGPIGDSKREISLNDVELKQDASPAAEIVEYMLFEGREILDTFGNHPSFCMFTLGNELHGDRKLISRIVERLRDHDPRPLYASGSNNFIWAPRLQASDDFWTTTMTGGNYKYGNYYPDTQGHEVRSSFPVHSKGQVNNKFPGTTDDYSIGIQGVPVPVISHENGQFQVYPNYNEIEKYTGVMAARNLMVFRDNLEQAGMLDQADDFFKASGALAVICYREDIESAIRTRGFGGFQLLDLQDFPGQGTALVGMLDVFMESKGLITPEEWSEFCNDVVPLLRIKKHVWTKEEMLIGGVQLANYGSGDIDSKLHWKLVDSSGKEHFSGVFKVESKQGTLLDAGFLRIDLNGLEAPQKFEIHLRLEGFDAKNAYPLWVYPEDVNTSAPEEILVARDLGDKTREKLLAGGTVLLLPDEELLKHSIAGAFQSDFWCYPMFKKYNPPGTLGILTDPEHPVFSSFPTEFHSNWQWWPLLKYGKSMILDSTPRDFRPIVQVIDNFERSHKLGVLFECKVGNGKLLVCSLNLLELQKFPEGRQFMSSILEYMQSDHFEPEESLELTDIQKIFAPN